MDIKTAYTDDELHFLNLLSLQYPTVQKACTEIINLNAIMNLPKGTEHFISDIHGEYEAFDHILNSCSGVIKEKLELMFGNTMTKAEIRELATLIYYPKEKMKQIAESCEDMNEFYRLTLYRLINLCRLLCSKYTRSKVRKALPPDYGYVIDELLNTKEDQENKHEYYTNIIESIIQIGKGGDFIQAVCYTIKRMAVDHLHIVGDIFDRGPRADIVMDDIMNYHSVDIQWGNHDILWMGAASGSRTLVATVVSNCIRYNNLDVLEKGYGISLRPLSVFANEVYKHVDTHCFAVKLSGEQSDKYSEKDIRLSARMHKAINIILYKLEGHKVSRRPEFGMEDRQFLHTIDYVNHTVVIKGKTYKLEDCDFPTIDPADPYSLTEDENRVINELVDAFQHSEKLQRHVRFLYTKGGIYKIFNGNLLYHGCVPVNDDGSFMEFSIGGKTRSGKEFLDYAEKTARKAYYDTPGSAERQFGMDFLWFLWAGRNSPIFGRDHLTTFERRLIADESAWKEKKNAYYYLYNDPELCTKILSEFGLSGKHCHIINGHVPVKAVNGESPIKGGGKLIVIDGGFCKAYQHTSGIAGYTLISNSHLIRIVSHQPFEGKDAAIKTNSDIVNDSYIFEKFGHRIKISETDTGKVLQARIDDLMALLNAYRSGAVTEMHNK